MAMAITATFDIYTAWRIPKISPITVNRVLMSCRDFWGRRRISKHKISIKGRFCPRVCQSPPLKLEKHYSHPHTKKNQVFTLKILKIYHWKSTDIELANWHEIGKERTFHSKLISSGFYFMIIKPSDWLSYQLEEWRWNKPSQLSWYFKSSHIHPNSVRDWLRFSKTFEHGLFQFNQQNIPIWTKNKSFQNI